MSFEKKLQTHKRLGPGGMNCTCCGPAPGKTRKKFLRTGKRRVKVFWKQEILRIAEEKV